MLKSPSKIVYPDRDANDFRNLIDFDSLPIDTSLNESNHLL